MAFEWGPQVIVSLIAAADLAEGTAVKLTASGIEPCDAITDRPFGISTTTVEAGDTARVGLVGVFKVKAGGNISVGNPVSIKADATALAVTVGTDTTKYIMGTALEGGATGEFIAVAISTPSAARAA